MPNGFPVRVLNQEGVIPRSSYFGSLGTNAYGIHLTITQTQISAAPSAGTIGNIYALNSSIGPQPGKALAIRGFFICCTNAATFQIRAGVATGPLAGANIGEKDVVATVGPAGGGVLGPAQQMYIPCSWVIRNGQSVIPYITKILDGTSATVSIWPDAELITDNFNYLTKHVAKIIGTSISNGTGPTATPYTYWSLMEGEMRKRGVSIRFDMTAPISGSTTAIHYTKVMKGEYDLTDMETVPSIVFFELCVNDASTSVSATNYTNRIKAFAERFLNHPEKKDILVGILGATPLENATARANAVNLDAAALALVTTLNASYNSRSYFLPGANAFTPTDTTKFVSTDTAGSRIHLNDSGCADYHANCTIPFLDGSGASIITKLKS